MWTNKLPRRQNVLLHSVQTYGLSFSWTVFTWTRNLQDLVNVFLQTSHSYLRSLLWTEFTCCVRLFFHLKHFSQLSHLWALILVCVTVWVVNMLLYVVEKLQIVQVHFLLIDRSTCLNFKCFWRVSSSANTCSHKLHVKRSPVVKVSKTKKFYIIFKKYFSSIKQQFYIYLLFFI